MELRLSELQREIIGGVERYLNDVATSQRARASFEADPQGFDHGLWEGLASLGVTGLAIGEAHGGLGLSELELGLVAECAGKFLLRAPLSSTLYASAAAIERLGSEAQRSHWLPRIASGETTAAYVDCALQGFAAPQSSGDGITSTFPVVPDAMAADILIVVSGPEAWLIDLAGEGVERMGVETIDPIQPSARVELTRARADPLPAGDAIEAAAWIRRRAAVLRAFELVGMCQRCIEDASAYARERRAFGRAIGSFQAVKHLLADMYVKMELARSNAYYAGWALATGHPSIVTSAASAHLSAIDAGRFCTANALQVHGGIGFTWELDCHLLYRRAHHIALQSGPPRLWEDELLLALASEREAA